MKTTARTVRYALFLIAIASLLLSISCNKKISPPDIPVGQSFSLVILSDPQIYWYSRPDGACKSTNPPPGTCAREEGETIEDCVKRCGKESNDNQITSIMNANSLQWNSANISINNNQQIKQVVAGIINGDLTAFWHPEEKDVYVDYYQDDEVDIPFPILAGLGNHDYFNNLCDCHGWFPWTSNSCARNAVSTLRDFYKDADNINFDDCSLAYSFDLGDFHFVQVNLNPSYSMDLNNYFFKCELDSFNISRDDCDGNIIGDAYDWLSTDLQNATTNNKISVINMHAAGDYSDSGKYWGASESQKTENKNTFTSIINQNSVAAVFGGHIHDKHGYMGDYKLNGNTITNGFGNTVPWFRSGASEYYTYLVAEFGTDPTTSDWYMNVGVVSSENGQTVFINSNGTGNDPPTTYILN